MQGQKEPLDESRNHCLRSGMEAFAVIGLVVFVIYLVLRTRREERPRRSPAALERERREGPSRADLSPATKLPPSAAPPKPKRTIPDHLVFAAERIGDRFHARTREQVDSMFSGARDELPRVRTQARAIEKLAKSYEAAARKARPPASPDISSATTTLAKVEFMISECERILDILYFEDDDDRRYWKILDDLGDLHSDIESAISDIEQTTKDIASGEYDEFWEPQAPSKRSQIKKRKNTSSFEIEYQDKDGVVTRRTISNARASVRNGYYLITAHCSLRDEERSFMSTRIQSCKNTDTGRAIKDLGRYLLNPN